MAPKIKCIIKRPDEEFGHMTSVSATLKNLQKNVGGYIETVTLYNMTPVGPGEISSSGLVIICNEEGRLKGLPHNCNVMGVDFVGDIIAIGFKGDDFCDIPISFAQWKGMVQP